MKAGLGSATEQEGKVLVAFLVRLQVDYFERAKRMVELPLLGQQYEEQRKTDREFHTEQESQRVSVGTALIPTQSVRGWVVTCDCWDNTYPHVQSVKGWVVTLKLGQ